MMPPKPLPVPFRVLKAWKAAWRLCKNARQLGTITLSLTLSLRERELSPLSLRERVGVREKTKRTYYVIY
jgi:hypothetical protein